MACPVERFGSCPGFATAEAVVDHVVAEHDSRLVATLLVRESYTNRRMTTVLDGLDMAIEKEIDALIPDPLIDNTVIEIQLGNER